MTEYFKVPQQGSYPSMGYPLLSRGHTVQNTTGFLNPSLPFEISDETQKYSEKQLQTKGQSFSLYFHLYFTQSSRLRDKLIQ